MQALIADATEAQGEVNDYVTSKQIGDTLHTAYPGFAWAVRVQWKQGIVDVYNLHLSGTHGFRIKLLGPNGVYSASDLDRQAKEAGGELLERYRVARRRINEEQIAYMPTDFAGRHPFDV